MNRRLPLMAVALMLALGTASCSDSPSTVGAGEAPIAFADVFEFLNGHGDRSGPPKPIQSLGDAYDFTTGPALLGSVVDLEPQDDPPGPVDEFIDNYSDRDVQAVVLIEEVLHGPPLAQGVGEQIRVPLPGALTVSREEAAAAAAAAGPMIFKLRAQVGEGTYVVNHVIVRDGDSFTILGKIDGPDDERRQRLTEGTGIATFDALVTAFRDLPDDWPGRRCWNEEQIVSPLPCPLATEPPPPGWEPGPPEAPEPPLPDAAP